MAFAQGSRTRLAWDAETTFGVTVSSPATTVLPYNTHSVDLTKDLVQSGQISSDRMPRVERHGNRRVAGDIVTELRDTDMDFLFESALFASFSSAGVLENGTTPSFFTLEDGALDITQFRVFNGCAVSRMNISARPNQMILGTFGIVGEDMTQTGTSIDATPTAASGGEPWDSFSGSISEGGSSIATLTGVEITLENSFSPTFVLGSAVTPQLEYGMSQVTGVMEAYYEDATLINKFINETESELSVTFNDPTSSGAYTFFLPRTKINGAAVPVGDPQSRIIRIPFTALYDSAETTQLRITKA